MLMSYAYKEAVLERIREAAGEAFTARGTTKEEVLADKELIEAIWRAYQEAVEGFDEDPSTAFAGALDECIGPLKAEDSLRPSGDPVHDMYADRPVALEKGQISELEDIISKERGSLDLLSTMARDGKLSLSDVRTHLTLMRYAYEDLSHMLDDGAILSYELEQRTAMLRDANAEIRRLKAEMGKGIKAGALRGALNRYGELLRAWYERLGFHYASLEYSPWGIAAELSGEMAPEGEDGHHLSDTEIYRSLSAVEPIQRVAQEEGCHAVLLDCAKNRNAVRAAVGEWLPDAQIQSFIGCRDRGGFVLRTKVMVPYAALDAMAEKAARLKGKA